jgi:hypothetical protein
MVSPAIAVLVPSMRHSFLLAVYRSLAMAIVSAVGVMATWDWLLEPFGLLTVRLKLSGPLLAGNL